MPNLRQIIVSKAEANNAVPVVAFDGDGALAGPSAMIIFASNNLALTPNDPTVTIQLFPSGHIAVGTDSNGFISVTASLFNSGDDQAFNIAGGGTYSHAAGLWPDRIRAVLTCVGDPGVEIDIQYAGFTLVDTIPSPPPFPTPTDVQITNTVNPDPDIPSKMDITVQFKNPDPVGYPTLHALIMRSRDNDPISAAVMVGSTPILSAGDHTFVDMADIGHVYTYYVYLYDASSLAITATPATVSTVLSGDPSGVYQITVGKTHDTVYNNHAAPTTTNIAIPTPFIKTGFIDG